MLSAEIIERFGQARVARLATVDQDRRPHLVPVTFALLDDRTIVTAVDHKPKRTTRLKRLANIAANPSVAVLADHYSDAWDELWWVRADGTARVIADAAARYCGGDDPSVAEDEHRAALDSLARRYDQYRDNPPAGPVIVIAVDRWSGWAAAAG